MKVKLDDKFIGNRIEVTFFKTNNEKDVFVSQFVEFKNDDRFVISTPIKSGSIVRIDLDTKLYVNFIYKYDLYRFKAKVISRYKKNDVYYLEIKKIESFENIQRREFYRFKTILDVEVERIVQELKETFKCTLNDLSGGGICITTNKSLKLGEIINCTLFLKDDNEIRFQGRVVRINELVSKIPSKQYGVRYLNIGNKDREMIIRYIFYEEIKLRKKGLI